METSILTSTKKILQIPASYTAFDQDIITHINAAFSILNQLGLGQPDGFMIEDASAEWEEFDVPMNQLNLVKTYIHLKVRILFDPPAMSFALEAAKEQVREYEFRLNVNRENALPEEVEL